MAKQLHRGGIDIGIYRLTVPHQQHWQPTLSPPLCAACAIALHTRVEQESSARAADEVQSACIQLCLSRFSTSCTSAFAAPMQLFPMHHVACHSSRSHPRPVTVPLTEYTPCTTQPTWYDSCARFGVCYRDLGLLHACAYSSLQTGGGSLSGATATFPLESAIAPSVCFLLAHPGRERGQSLWAGGAPVLARYSLCLCH